MLDDLEAGDGVEELAGRHQLLDRGGAVGDGEPLRLGVRARGGDGLARRVDAGHRGAHARERLAHEPAAAADVEQSEAGERAHAAGGRPK